MSHHKDTQSSRSNSGAVLDFPESKTIQVQAAEWLAKLDAEQPNKTDLAESKQWVNADPTHRSTFEELVEFWDEMNILTQAVLPRELQVSEQNREQNREQKPQLSAFSYTKAAMGTAFLSVVTLVIALTIMLTGPTIYTTEIGEQQTIKLADNSKVQLNTNSRLEVDYSDKYRRLTLSHGEAHFDVAHNPDRPFEVYAGQGLVRAIGTAFTVHIRKIDIEVLVTEGTVELDRAETGSQVQQPPSAPIINTNVVIPPNSNISPQQATEGFAPGLKVSAGNKVMYDKQLLDNVKLIVATQIEEQLSWRQGMLLFKGEPLQKVVDEVSRYTQLKIIIPERSARELKVGGYLKSATPNPFLKP